MVLPKTRQTLFRIFLTSLLGHQTPKCNDIATWPGQGLFGLLRDTRNESPEQPQEDSHRLWYSLEWNPQERPWRSRGKGGGVELGMEGVSSVERL